MKVVMEAYEINVAGQFSVNFPSVQPGLWLTILLHLFLFLSS